MNGQLYIPKIDLSYHEPAENLTPSETNNPRPITVAQIAKAFDMVEDTDLRIRILEYLDSLVKEEQAE